MDHKGDREGDDGFLVFFLFLSWLLISYLQVGFHDDDEQLPWPTPHWHTAGTHHHNYN